MKRTWIERRVGGDRPGNGNDGFRSLTVTPDGTLYATGTGAAGWPTTVGPAFALNGDVPVLKVLSWRV